MKALGIHVFAGGFSHGVKQHFDVECQLETHGFGLDTARELFGVDSINCEAKKWPKLNDISFAFGNPRCTGFSTILSGYDDELHGPWSKQTCDIHEFSHYVVKHKIPIAIWESVQQAASTGKELLRYLIDKVYKKHYRIAHVFVNAASCGNSQERRRYFFVAYSRDLQFNIVPPVLPKHHACAYDVLYETRNVKTNIGTMSEYDEHSTLIKNENDLAVIPLLPNGWCLNLLARWNFDALPDHYKDKFLFRTSNFPFSLHSVRRLSYFTPVPTLTSSCFAYVHPEVDRALTVGELAKCMGWPGIPVGRAPTAQIAKGVVPAVGAWLAEQAKLCLEGAWGDEDWYSTWNGYRWVGDDAHGALEKTFNLTSYTQQEKPYDVAIKYGTQHHRFNVERSSGKLIRSWAEVAEQARRYSGDDVLRIPSGLSFNELTGFEGKEV